MPMLFRIMMTLIVVSLAIGSAGIGAAQEVPAEPKDVVPSNNSTATNSTETPVANATPEDSGGGIVVDEYLRLTEWEYIDGTFHLTFEADRTSVITMTEVVQPQRGAGEMSIQRQRLASGTTTLKIDVARVAGHAAVSITTSRSLDAGRGVYVSTGQGSGISPLERTTSTAGWLGGAGVACVMFGCAAYQRRNKDWAAVEEAE